jgi:hypothetical protein
VLHQQNYHLGHKLFEAFGFGPFSSDLVISSTAVIASRPDNLITDIPALPGADASAKMVSKRQLLLV